MELCTIRVQGISAILMNNGAALLLQTEGPKTRKSIPTAEVEAERGAYRNPEGSLCFPTGAFRKAAISGAKGRKVGRTGLNTILMGAIFAYTEFTDLIDPDSDDPIKDYEIDIRRAVPPGQGAVRRARPKIWPWAAEVQFEYDEEITDEATIQEVLRMGGRTVGVGNYRPEKGGPYGRFVVVD